MLHFLDHPLQLMLDSFLLSPIGLRGTRNSHFHCSTPGMPSGQLYQCRAKCAIDFGHGPCFVRDCFGRDCGICSKELHPVPAVRGNGGTLGLHGLRLRRLFPVSNRPLRSLTLAYASLTCNACNARST